jgi:hypothetical protein
MPGPRLQALASNASRLGAVAVRHTLLRDPYFGRRDEEASCRTSTAPGRISPAPLLRVRRHLRTDRRRLTGRLVATRDTLRLVPLLRREVLLRRSEIAAIEFERQWAPPFWIKTVVHFRLVDGMYAPKVFIGPTRRVREGLEMLGWPIERVQFGAVSERRRHPLRALLNRET